MECCLAKCKSIKKKDIHVFFAQECSGKALSHDCKTPKATKQNTLCRCVPFSLFVKDSYPKLWKTHFGMNCGVLFFPAVLS